MRSPRHTLFLNSQREFRFTRCPLCGEKTRQRKIPLVIHIEPRVFLSLHKTCRLCPECDLLICHRDLLEAELTHLCEQRDPDVVGNDYTVIGTIERADWKRGRQAPLDITDLFGLIHPFRDSVIFETTGGWGPAP